jgi:hypothetical protein
MGEREEASMPLSTVLSNQSAGQFPIAGRLNNLG